MQIASSSRAPSMPPMSTTSDQPKSASTSLTVRLAASSSPAISIVGWPSRKLGSTKYGLPMMLNALTTFASGSACWTRSSSESSPVIESFGGKPPEKSSGLVASITTLPPKLAGPAAAIASSAALPSTVPTSTPAPSPESQSLNSGLLGSASRSSRCCRDSQPPPPNADPPHPFPAHQPGSESVAHQPCCLLSRSSTHDLADPVRSGIRLRGVSLLVREVESGRSLPRMPPCHGLNGHFWNPSRCDDRQIGAHECRDPALA